MKTRVMVAVAVLLLSVGGSVAEGEKAGKEITPTAVVKVFWYKIGKGDVDGALSLFTFSDRTKALMPRQRATFAMWSTVMKKGATVVDVGPEKVAGVAATVLVTSHEGKSKVRREVMYLVRKEGLWRMLPYAVPGDSPAHQLDKETNAAMAQLKRWARREMKKAEAE